MNFQKKNPTKIFKNCAQRVNISIEEFLQYLGPYNYAQHLENYFTSKIN